MIYAYVRNMIWRTIVAAQTEKITEEYPEAEIVREKFIVKDIDYDNELQNLIAKVTSKDTVVMDSVFRLGRLPTVGYYNYLKLYDKSVNIVFIDEPYLNSAVYRRFDLIFPEDSLKELIRLQIKGRYITIRDEQRDPVFLKHRNVLKKKTDNKTNISPKYGEKFGKIKTENFEKMKQQIMEESRYFNGDMSDAELAKKLGLPKATFFRYKYNIFEDLEFEDEA